MDYGPQTTHNELQQTQRQETHFPEKSLPTIPLPLKADADKLESPNPPPIAIASFKNTLLATPQFIAPPPPQLSILSSPPYESPTSETGISPNPEQHIFSYPVTLPQN